MDSPQYVSKGGFGGLPGLLSMKGVVLRNKPFYQGSFFYRNDMKTAEKPV